MAEMQRLGIQQTGMDPRYAADTQFAQNVNHQTTANNQANLGMQQANADQISQLLGGMAMGSQSSAMGQAMNIRNADITSIHHDQRDSLQDIMNQIMDTKKNKPGAMMELLQQLQGQGFDQWSQLQGIHQNQQQLNMQRQAQRMAAAQAAAEARMGANLWQGSNTPGNVGYNPGGGPGKIYGQPGYNPNVPGSSAGPANGTSTPKKTPKSNGIRHGIRDDIYGGPSGWVG